MAIWTEKEVNDLKNNTSDGVTVAKVESIIGSRKPTAIIKKAQQLNYGVKTIDGVQCFYYGIKNRNRRTKAEIDEDLSSEKTTILGESRVAVTTQESIVEQTTKNVSDIVANKATDTTKSEFLSIYDVITSLFSNSTYSSLQSITITLTNASMTLTKDPL